MFRALGRWIKAVGYLLTGQIDSARRVLDTNPLVMRAKYDEIVTDKIARIQQYKQAVAGLIAQQEKKMQSVKGLTEDTKRLENLKAGALAKAKRRVNELTAQGRTQEAIHADEEYLKCLSAYNDFSSTTAEKQARIEELETDIGAYSNRIAEHKVQLQSLLREVEKLRMEAVDAVADLITAKQEKEISDTIAGIAEDGTAAELSRMRQLRQEIKAEARISKELAGTDTRAAEAEFLAFARQSENTSDFDALIGLAADADRRAKTEDKKESERPTGLPE